MKLVKNITDRNGEEVAQMLRDLADLAESGELVGVTVAGLCKEKRPVSWVAGLCARDVGMALLAAGKMFNLLLSRPFR